MGDRVTSPSRETHDECPECGSNDPCLKGFDLTEDGACDHEFHKQPCPFEEEADAR